MVTTTPVTHIFGLNSQFEVEVMSLPIDALTFVTDASKSGCYSAFFMKDTVLWIRVVGPFDQLTDFRSTL